MEPLFHIAPYSGYVYPNETVFPWTVMIVVYPYLTGLVAGAFTVSSFYHVFGLQQFRPVSRLALLTALACMIFVPYPLLMHLGHPERAFNAMITPHITSAFVAFGYFALFYVCLLILEIWFVFRVDIVARAESATGLVKQFYRALSLWSNDVSDKARAIDHKIMFVLAVTGIPAAHGLHGYVGFVFASLKSREWWGSDMMPAVFLFSAIISGVALLIVLYITISKIRRVPIDEACVRGLVYALWGFMMFTLLLEGVEFATLVYKGKEGIDIILVYVARDLFYRFFVFQFGVGAILPIILITIMVFRKVRGKTFITVSFICGLLVLMQVFLMRWNVVISGQEIAKTMRGLLTYHVPIFGGEGLIVALSALFGPLVLLWIFTWILPPWLDRPAAAE
ncbi:MAG: polysulfide reductase NrfD [Alphaproteobacteria bacterium]|nr:polysulfide reductase NrfD [Alphaproteobacteria bacterium]